MFEDIKIDVNLTRWEIARYNLYHIRWLLFLNLVGVIVFICIVYLSFTHPQASTREMLGTISIWAAVILALGLSQPFILIMQIYILKTPAIEDQMAPRSYSFTIEGIHVESCGRMAKAPWTKVRMLRDTGRMLLIFTSPKLAYVIPKRCFISASQVESFARFLSERLKKAK